MTCARSATLLRTSRFKGTAIQRTWRHAPASENVMAIGEEAQRNHDALFPNHKSTLKVTDPELVEVFDNWAFDEVLKYGVLDTGTRLMVQLAGLIACQAV